MMTRPLVIAVLGSLLTTAPVQAERRTRRDDRKEDRDDDRRSGSSRKDDRRRASSDEEDGVTERRRLGGDDRRSGGRAGARRAAQIEDDESDGPEAKGAVVIKLDDLIEVAVRRAPELARSKADKAAARGQAAAAGREQQWSVTAKGEYTRNAVGADVIDVPPLSEVDVEEQKASLTLGRKLPTGGDIGLEVGFSRTSRELALPAELVDVLQGNAPPPAPGMNPAAQPEIPDEFKISQRAYAQVTLKQPVLRGFGPDVALAAQRKADLVSSEATVRTQLTAEKMIKEVVQGYWELAYQAYDTDVRAESLALAQKQDVVTRNEIRAGTVAQTQLNAVTFEIMSRNEALLASQNEYERKSLDLRNKIGLELDRRDVVIRPADAFEIGQDEWDIEDIRARAHKMNRNLVALALARRAADVDVKAAKNGMLPALDFTLSGGIQGNGLTSDKAFSGAAAADGFTVMAGIQLQFEIGGAAKGNYDAANARLRKTEIEQIEAVRALDTEVVRAVKTVTSARARVGFADKAIEVAEENVRAEAALFQAKATTNFSVMQRQTELINAKLRRGRAIADYHVAVAELQFMSGLLLEQYGVRVRPGVEK